MRQELTKEDIRSMHYYMTERDDLMRYAGWEDCVPILAVKHRELLLTLELKQMADKRLHEIMDKLWDEYRCDD